MTPEELRFKLESRTPKSYFFEPKTMEMFGDTMENYGVKSTTVVERQYSAFGERRPHKVECWELYRRQPVGDANLQTSAFFEKKTFRQVHL